MHVRVRMRACVLDRMSVCMHACACVLDRMSVCMHVCAYMHVHVCLIK